MAIRTTEAIVLKNQPFRDTSLIATLLTKDFGKIVVLAKGIRARYARKDSKFFCYLEPLSLNKIVYYEKSRSGLHLVTQSDLLNQFQPIRHDLNRLSIASFMLELADKGTPFEDADRKIFDLLVCGLNRLCEDNFDLQQTLLNFQTQFLKLSGFMPKSEKLDMPIMDFIKIHIDDEFKTLEFMEKLKNG